MQLLPNKTLSAKRLKAIKALADRGIGGEKENAERLYKELSQKKKKAPDTEEIKNAKMHINNKIDSMCEDRWDEKTLKAMLRVKFKVSINQVESITTARDMYEYLIWLTHLAKNTKYKIKHDLINF